MKILFLSGWYPNRLNVHLGNFVQKHAEAVALQSEVAILFVCADVNCKIVYEIEQRTVNNVFTVNVYYKKVNHSVPLLSHIQRGWRYLNAHRKGWHIIKKKMASIDVAHHNILYPAGIIAWLLKRLYGYAYIITEHSTEYLTKSKTLFSPVRNMLTAFIAKNASFITPVTENLKAAMISRGIKGNYKVVNNVVDTRLFVPQQKSNVRFKFIHISTLLDGHKNVSGMLRTIALLSKEQNDFECLFIGESDATSHIALAQELGIYKSFVNFDSNKTTAEIASLLKSSDCFFMFSNYENMPVVISEALACGLPVIASRVGGIHEHINSSNGLLVPPGDEAALLSAFQTMLNNLKEKIYNPEALHDYAVKNFSYEAVSKRFHEIYTETQHAV